MSVQKMYTDCKQQVRVLYIFWAGVKGQNLSFRPIGNGTTFTITIGIGTTATNAIAITITIANSIAIGNGDGTP